MPCRSGCWTSRRSLRSGRTRRRLQRLPQSRARSADLFLPKDRFAFFLKRRQTFREILGGARLLLGLGFARQLRLMALAIPEKFACQRQGGGAIGQAPRQGLGF